LNKKFKRNKMMRDEIEKNQENGITQKKNQSKE
jgi:hypothetical protein